MDDFDIVDFGNTWDLPLTESFFDSLIDTYQHTELTEVYHDEVHRLLDAPFFDPGATYLDISSSYLDANSMHFEQSGVTTNPQQNVTGMDLELSVNELGLMIGTIGVLNAHEEYDEGVLIQTPPSQLSETMCRPFSSSSKTYHHFPETQQEPQSNQSVRTRHLKNEAKKPRAKSLNTPYHDLPITTVTTVPMGWEIVSAMNTLAEFLLPNTQMCTVGSAHFTPLAGASIRVKGAPKTKVTVLLTYQELLMIVNLILSREVDSGIFRTGSGIIRKKSVPSMDDERHYVINSTLCCHWMLNTNNHP
ncbi:hypothetical protein RvY_14851 [Ramazzottius varieornatus]|uniref:Uncharacterized protein n=1 Tax=Ramazzottius varieornatus TaxID=947166 RepID=A0A1D1VSR4_RAMVA|nr:hypothetical protein RvY_14851 [Ramazzottius varieornatus]